MNEIGIQASSVVQTGFKRWVAPFVSAPFVSLPQKMGGPVCLKRWVAPFVSKMGGPVCLCVLRGEISQTEGPKRGQPWNSIFGCRRAKRGQPWNSIFGCRQMNEIGIQTSSVVQTGFKRWVAPFVSQKMGGPVCLFQKMGGPVCLSGIFLLKSTVEFRFL